MPQVTTIKLDGAFQLIFCPMKVGEKRGILEFVEEVILPLARREEPK
jgi:hypothetical protein